MILAILELRRTLMLEHKAENFEDIASLDAAEKYFRNSTDPEISKRNNDLLNGLRKQTREI